MGHLTLIKHGEKMKQKWLKNLFQPEPMYLLKKLDNFSFQS